MTTAAPTQTESGIFFSSGLNKTATFRGDAVEVQSDGTGLVKGIKIFRAGTFRDSLGEQQTWEPMHLAQMASHFSLLRENEVFIDVPIRKGHSFQMSNLMGYFQDMRHEGNFIVADFHITEPEDVERFQRGHYRNFSAEVGMYVTNDETPYWPVMMGVAAVDIPAIEGLFGKTDTDNKIRFFTYGGDDKMTTENAGTPPADAGAKPPTAAPFTFSINGAETTDFGAVQRYIAEQDGRIVTLTKERDGLQTTVDGAVKTERETYCKALSADGKVAAPMVEGLVKMTAPDVMSAEQFEQFKTVYDAAEKNPLFEKHGSTGDGTQPPGNEPSVAEAKAEEISVLEEQISMHRRAKMTDDFIKNTDAFKRLQILKGSN